VVGELTPKRIAMARAERWALFAALPLRWLGIASKPAVWLLSTSTGLLVRLAGVDPKESGDEVSDDELRDLLLSRSGFHRQREILEGALEIGDRVLRQILVPRPAVTTVPTDATVAEAMSLLKEAGHSRAPLCDDLDRVSGILHLIDLVDAQGPAAAVVRPALHLPETVGVLEALRAMQHGRHSLAIVVDEHGGGAGIVSLEDVLEEFVGEIYDEFDQDQRTVEVADDGSIAVDGTYPVHDLDDIGVELPSTEAATVAGVILEHLGRLPRRGEQVTIGGWTLVVDHIEEQAIRRVVLVPSGDDDAEQS
jgi:putative hemolysin